MIIKKLIGEKTVRVKGEFMEGKSKSEHICNFEDILNTYEKKVYSFIYNMIRDQYAAQDITQDVFIKVYKNLFKYNSEYPIEPWIFKIAYNTTANYLKKNKNRKNEVELNEKIDDVYIYEDNIARIDIQESILKTMRSFRPDCKAIFALRIMEELTFEQIAEILGTTNASVKLKFYRYRKILIDEFNREV